MITGGREHQAEHERMALFTLLSMPGMFFASSLLNNILYFKADVEWSFLFGNFLNFNQSLGVFMYLTNTAFYSYSEIALV